MSAKGSPRPRPELADLTTYASSDTSHGRVFLHANENPYAPPPHVMEEILAATAKLELNRYPDPGSSELIAEIADYTGVDPSCVWIGDGSNEVLLQACLAFGGPGRTALLFEPTYVMHYRQARIAGTEVAVVRRRDDFAIDLDEALSAIDRIEPDVVFICTPNNPTGTLTPLEHVQQLVRATRALVVVDEAYFEFCGESIVPHLAKHPNLLVSRTLSKAFRFAGVRIGYGLGAPELLTELRRVRMPYAQSAFTQAAATIALRYRQDMLAGVPALIAERERLGAALAGVSGCRPFPSGANFVLFRHERAAALLDHLAELGIVIRDFTHLEGCENCLRVTAGTPAENDEFLDAVLSF